MVSRESVRDNTSVLREFFKTKNNWSLKNHVGRTYRRRRLENVPSGGKHSEFEQSRGDVKMHKNLTAYYGYFFYLFFFDDLNSPILVLNDY